MRNYYNPVKLTFLDAFDEVESVLSEYGNHCLLVIQDDIAPMQYLRDRLIEVMNEQGVEVDLFNRIRPNPRQEDVDLGIEMIENNHYDFVVAIGGGSTIDTSKVLAFSKDYALEWESMYMREVIKSNENRLPLIAIPTTSGTGSHVTQASVVSDSLNVKHTIFSMDFFPTEAIIIPELTKTLPNHLTASTAFDAFCHLSESYINNRYSDISELMTLDGIKKIIDSLPKVLKENHLEHRQALSIADTYAGLALSNGGANVPHTFGECLTSASQKINHGQSLAIIYPYFVKHYFNCERYKKGISKILALLNNKIEPQNPMEATMIVCGFLDQINLSYRLSDYNLSEKELTRVHELLKSQRKFNDDCVSDFIKDILRSDLGF